MFSSIHERFGGGADFWWVILCSLACYKGQIHGPDQDEQQWNGKFWTEFRINLRGSWVVISCCLDCDLGGYRKELGLVFMLTLGFSGVL
jgi:hypothetical protein